MDSGQDSKAPLAAGRLLSIQTSNGGVPKRPVPGPVRISAAGVEGDRQRDLRFHGGPDRAVCLLAHERILALRAEGHPIEPGSTGENLTVSGLDWASLGEGTRLRVGAVDLEITGPAHPCRNIAGSFSDGDFSRLSAKKQRGAGRLYARVLVPGDVSPGDRVEVLQGS